jgi:hypothetical protein
VRDDGDAVAVAVAAGAAFFTRTVLVLIFGFPGTNITAALAKVSM